MTLKKKKLLIATIIFFLLVNTTYYWEGKLGLFAFPFFLIMSIAYLVQADENQQLVVKTDENSDVKWIPIEEVTLYSNEPHMQKVYEKLICKIKVLL